MPGVFVTATGTDVGKTFVTAGLIRACRRAKLPVNACKPVLSGYEPAQTAESDAGILLAALGRRVGTDTIAAMSPWRFSAPLSPDMAADLEGRSIDVAAVNATCRGAISDETLTFIEGVGGVMVPLDAHHTVMDLIEMLALPIVLITGSGLGAISHCLTAVTALAARSLAPEMIVLNESPACAVPLAATVRTLRNFCPGVPFATIPRAPPEAAFDEVLAYLRQQLPMPLHGRS